MWMGSLRSCLADRKLSNIVIPGSHDTLTYTYTFAGQLLDIATTQDKNITEQLNDGIRAFDLRVGWHYDLTYGWGYYPQHGDWFAATSVKLPEVLADIEQWALDPSHENEIIVLNLAINQTSNSITGAFPTSDCQSFGAALGGSLVTPNQLNAKFGTTDPGQVTLGQLWSLPDPKHAARVIMSNDQCMDAADPSAGQWSTNGGGYYANQITANGRPPGPQLGPSLCPNQEQGITKMVLAAARSRATGAGGTPNALGPPKVGGLYELDIQGTPLADCLYAPKNLVNDERIALNAVHNAWLAEPSIRRNLNVVSGDYVEDIPLTADAIATDRVLGAGPGFEVAAQTGAGSLSGARHLWSAGFDQHGDWGPGLKAGTSPAITALPGGGYEMAFEGGPSRPATGTCGPTGS
jgi:hypothetical protein